MTFLAHARLPVLILGLSLGIAYAATAAWPIRYLATARVLVSGERMVRLEHAANDPHSAASALKGHLAGYLRAKAELIDPPMVRAQRPSTTLSLAIGGAAGLAISLGILLYRHRRARPVRTERELVDALGPPLLAARPVRKETLRPLCLQLLDHWFGPERALLAVVGTGEAQARSGFTAQLAVTFAELGCRTLVIDADFRCPSLHRAFSLPNAHGLADFLQDRRVSLASAGDNLTVMVAGSATKDPLELLSRPRLAALIAEARRHFRVVLIDTPLPGQGPDFQMLAAHAGGALVVCRRPGADVAALVELRTALQRCAAQLVTTVIQEG